MTEWKKVRFINFSGNSAPKQKHLPPITITSHHPLDVPTISAMAHWPYTCPTHSQYKLKLQKRKVLNTTYFDRGSEEGGAPSIPMVQIPFGDQRGHLSPGLLVPFPEPVPLHTATNTKKKNVSLSHFSQENTFSQSDSDSRPQHTEWTLLRCCNWEKQCARDVAPAK